jgi:hypothetical protein
VIELPPPTDFLAGQKNYNLMVILKKFLLLLRRFAKFYEILKIFIKFYQLSNYIIFRQLLRLSNEIKQKIILAHLKTSCIKNFLYKIHAELISFKGAALKVC